MSDSQAFSVLKDQVSSEEWQTRLDLAAAYRLVARQGWDDLIFTHLSARVPGPEEHFLINAFGLLFCEVTASNLVKVDLSGKVIAPAGALVNPAGFLIHGSVHRARPDVMAVMHTHTLAGIAVSARKDGLLPLSQTALTLMNEIAYHDYGGIALDPAECDRLVRDLGDKRILILRNHGLLTAGRSIAEAYLILAMLEKACAIQLAAQNGALNGTRNGSDDLILQTAAMADRVAEQTRHGFGMAAQMCWAALRRELDRSAPDYAS